MHGKARGGCRGPKAALVHSTGTWCTYGGSVGLGARGRCRALATSSRRLKISRRVRCGGRHITQDDNLYCPVRQVGRNPSCIAQAACRAGPSCPPCDAHRVARRSAGQHARGESDVLSGSLSQMVLVVVAAVSAVACAQRSLDMIARWEAAPNVPACRRPCLHSAVDITSAGWPAVGVCGRVCLAVACSRLKRAASYLCAHPADENLAPRARGSSISVFFLLF